jgi:uncharacterized protein (DUF1697 family)
MTTYIAILRGINVGGKRIIKMELLRTMFADLGFKNVKTYIQSGNVVFECNKMNADKIESKIENEILKQFNFEVPVLIREANELREIAAANPFINDPKKDKASLHITFLSATPVNNNISKMEEGLYPDDEFNIIDKAVYLYCPNGYSNSKLTNGYIETKLKVRATTRNWKTVNELISIANNNY